MKRIGESMDRVVASFMDRAGVKSLTDAQVVASIKETREKYILSNLPPRYLRYVKQPIQDADEIFENIRRGNIVTITGTVGSGKSCFAAAIAYQFAGFGINIESIQSVDFAFFSGTGIVFELQGGYSDGRASEIRDRIRNRKLLLIDDLFAGETTSSIHREILYLIDSRYAERKATILTTNLTLTEIAAIDARIASRIVEGFILKLDGKDRRLNK